MASRFSVLSNAILETARISVPTVYEALRGAPPDHAVFDARLERWSRSIVENAQVSIATRGLDNVPAGEVVVMSNHASLYDVPILFQTLPKRMRMITKTELFKIPVWGRAMRFSGFIEIDRSDRDRARAALDAARACMKRDGISIWIAPEGTRSKTGALGEFKQGGFHLALDAGLPILPVTLIGTNKVLGAGTANLEVGARVEVIVHPPIDPAAYGQERRKELSAAVRAAIAGPLEA